MNFRTLPLFDSSSVTVCNPPSRTLFQSSGGWASLGLFPCSRHAGPPSHQGVRRREGELEVERVCRAGWAPPPPPPPPPPPFLSWTLEPLPSRSWGKPLNTRLFSAGSGQGLQPFTRRPLMRFQNSQSKVKGAWPPHEKGWAAERRQLPSVKSLLTLKPQNNVQ